MATSNILHGKTHVPSTGPFSMATLNYQRILEGILFSEHIQGVAIRLLSDIHDEV